MSEERVVEALRALRDADRDVEAGPDVEARLMRAVAVQVHVARRHAGRRVWLAAGVASVAAAAAGFVFLQARRPNPLPPAPPQSIAAAVPSPPAIVAAVEPPKPHRVRPKPSAPREVTTEFYPLMELAPPFERGELVRLTVPASTMRDVGFFVNASHLDDPVQADVLIGQEGLARAIRFVSYQ